MNLNKMCQKCKTIMPNRLFIPAILNGKTTGHDLCPVCTYDLICDLHGMKKGTLPTGQFAKEMVLEGRQYQRSTSQNALKKKL